MKKMGVFFFAFLIQAMAPAQPATKQVLVAGNGPAVVLLHGGTFDYHAFAPHSKLLADSFTAIRMQQFNVQYAAEGHTLPHHYSVTTESEAVQATLDLLRITQPIVLIGHSYGGVIAFDFALNHPQRVGALVLVEAPLFDLARIKGAYSEQMKQIDELTRDFTPQASITEAMIKSFRCKMVNCDQFNIYQHPMWRQWLLQKNRLRGLSVVGQYKIDLEKLHAFQQPVLIVTGTTTIEPNKTIDSLLSREFPNATTAALPGDHISVYQNPENFVQLLKVFLRTSRNP